MAADPLATLASLEGVPSAVAAARDAVDAVLRDRGRRAVTPDQSATAMITAARSSAWLEDDQGAVEAGLGAGAGWEPPTVRLYSELVELSGLIRVSPGQAIARAHTVLARGLLADDDLGRIRPGAGLGERMAALQRLLAGRTTAPVIVLAAIAHAELITAAPFVAGNGIVARAVEHMILIDGDIDRPAVIVPEAGHRALAAAYRAALQSYAWGSAAGVRAWLLHAAAAVTKGAELSPVKPVRRR